MYLWKGKERDPVAEGRRDFFLILGWRLERRDEVVNTR
jgi:hypothetical protein